MTDLVAPRSLVADLAALRSGTTSRADYLETLADRLETVEPTVHAYVPEPGRRERWRTSVATDGPLAGVPVGIKDIIAVDQMVTRAGSSLPPELFAGPQATVVDRLLAAGALVAGQTVTAEFAVSAPGPTANPHDPQHTPGGSSSGSAAAVASGSVPLALGTQTIGSVIRPAAYCGVVGYRATCGRIPTDGIIANAPTLDTVGLFTADVGSAAVAAGVLVDDWAPSWSTPSSRLVLGIPAGPLVEQASPASQDAYAAHTERLRRGGIELRVVPVLADFAELTAQLRVLNRYELARTHAAWFPRWRDDYRPETIRAIEEGLAFTAAQYAEACAWRLAFITRFTGEMAEAGIDAWVSPSTTGPAPRGLHGTGDATMCFPYSLAGLPAVTLPAGTDPAGLPLGLQLAGRLGQDEQLLATAAVVETTLTASR